MDIAFQVLYGVVYKSNFIITDHIIMGLETRKSRREFLKKGAALALNVAPVSRAIAQEQEATRESAQRIHNDSSEKMIFKESVMIGQIPVTFSYEKIFDVKSKSFQKKYIFFTIDTDRNAVAIDVFNNSLVPWLEAAMKNPKYDAVIARMMLIIAKRNTNQTETQGNKALANSYFRQAYIIADSQKQYLIAGEAAQRLGNLILQLDARDTVPAQTVFMQSWEAYTAFKKQQTIQSQSAKVWHAILSSLNRKQQDELPEQNPEFLDRNLAEVCLRLGNIFDKEAIVTAGIKKIFPNETMYNRRIQQQRAQALSFYSESIQYQADYEKNYEAYFRIIQVLTYFATDRNNWATALKHISFLRNVLQSLTASSVRPPRGEDFEAWKANLDIVESHMRNNMDRWVKIEIKQRTSQASALKGIYLCDNGNGQFIMKTEGSLERISLDDKTILLCPLNNDPEFNNLPDVKSKARLLMVKIPELQNMSYDLRPFESEYPHLLGMIMKMIS